MRQSTRHSALRRHPPGSPVTIFDGFCGAGGTATGIEQALAQQPDWGGAAEIRIALNHNPYAVASYAANHPTVEVVQADINLVDPWRLPACRVGLFSAECDEFSRAKQHRQATMARAAQRPLWAAPPLDPTAEHKRMLMFEIPRFAFYHEFDVVIVENVPEVRQWCLWDAWVQAMQKLDYAYREVYLNSQFTGVPQSRDRLYVVCWKTGLPAPNLEFTPLGWCRQCERNVPAVQAWKNPRQPWGYYGPRGQYLYLCPACGTVVPPYYPAAANIIDWTNLGPTIGDRRRPLCANTTRRITRALAEFTAPQPYWAVADLHDWPATLVEFAPTGPPAALVGGAFVLPLDHTSAAQRATPLGNPLRTQTSTDCLTLITPPDGPARPTRFQPHGEQPCLIKLRGTSTAARLDAPLPTLTGGGHHEYLLTPPARLVTAAAAAALAQWPSAGGAGEPPSLADCHYRSLTLAEIKAGMGFPADYQLQGSRKIQAALAGQAVCPPTMAALFARCLPILA